MRMKKIALLLVAFFPFVLTCGGQGLEPGMWHDFRGTRGDQKLQVSLIVREDGTLTGSQCLLTQDSKITFSGRREGGQIILSLADGEYRGMLDAQDVFRGTWKEIAGGKSLPFQMTLQSTVAGSPEKRYAFMGGTDAELERFVRNLKAALRNEDHEWVARQVSYPLRVNSSSQRSQMIKNKAQLIASFSKVFSPALRSRLGQDCSCHLFHNYQGAMLAEGMLWIGDMAQDGQKGPVFRIFSVNLL